MRRFFLVVTGIMLVVILFFLFPIQVPLSIEAIGRILPAKKWDLLRGQDGRLISTLYDNSIGSIESYTVTHVDRGDYVTFRLLPTMKSGALVAIGDPVGLIYSNEVESQLTKLRGELATEMASLSLNSTGEKDSVIKEAQLHVAQAEKQAEQQGKEVARFKALYKNKLIPKAELENAETTLRMYAIEVDRAKADLISVRTGAKKQQIDLVRSRISALKDEMSILQKRLNASSLTSPITGCVSHSFSGDVLVEIVSSIDYIVLLTIKWKDRELITPKQRIKLKIDGFQHTPTAKIKHVGQKIDIVNGEQVFEIIATIETGQKDLLPGLIARCSLLCGPVSLLEYLQRFLSA
jgi:hypothetical protein